MYGIDVLMRIMALETNAPSMSRNAIIVQKAMAKIRRLDDVSEQCIKEERMLDRAMLDSASTAFDEGGAALRRLKAHFDKLVADSVKPAKQERNNGE